MKNERHPKRTKEKPLQVLPPTFAKEQELRPTPHFNVLIIGGGPGGIGASIALLTRMQENNAALSLGIIDPNGLGGRIGEYKITANSSAGDMVKGIEKTAIKSVVEHPSVRAFMDSPLRAPKLQEVGLLYKEGFGQAIANTLTPEGLISQQVAKIVKDDSGFHAINGQGQEIASTDKLILATGAHETIMPELTQWADKTIVSQDIFTYERITEIRTQLENLPLEKRRFEVVGNSHGGWAVVDTLLRTVGDLLPPGGIHVLERNTTKVFFSDPDEAKRANYPITKNDICPKTRRVNRFGGVRHDARYQYRQAADHQEPRVTITPYDNLTNLSDAFTDATFIIQATGLTTNIIPIETPTGELMGPYIKQGLVHVSPKAQVLDVFQNPIENLWAIGIGYEGANKPSKEIGGEPSYRRSLHAANIYRLIGGPLIAEQIVPPAEKKRKPRIISIFPLRRFSRAA